MPVQTMQHNIFVLFFWNFLGHGLQDSPGQEICQGDDVRISPQKVKRKTPAMKWQIAFQNKLHFTNLEPQKLYADQKCLTADFEAPKFRNGRSGSRQLELDWRSPRNWTAEKKKRAILFWRRIQEIKKLQSLRKRGHFVKKQEQNLKIVNNKLYCTANQKCSSQSLTEALKTYFCHIRVLFG